MGIPDFTKPILFFLKQGYSIKTCYFPGFFKLVLNKMCNVRRYFHSTCESSCHNSKGRRERVGKKNFMIKRDNLLKWQFNFPTTETAPIPKSLIVLIYVCLLLWTYFAYPYQFLNLFKRLNSNESSIKTWILKYQEKNFFWYTSH